MAKLVFRKTFDNLLSRFGQHRTARDPEFSLPEVREIISRHHALLLELYGVPLGRHQTEALRERLGQDTDRAGNLNATPAVGSHSPGGDWAVFTPLPPTASGVADYAAELAPALGARLNATYIIADDAPDPEPQCSGLSVQRLTEWKSDRARDRATPRLYHLGNSVVHDYITEELLQRPGVVVLHEMVLHHLFEEITLARGETQTFRKLATEHYGRQGAEVAELTRRGLSGDAFRFGLPFSGPVLQNATAVIVHSFELLYQIHDLMPELPVQRIPFQYSRATPPGPAVITQARELLGIDPDRLVIVALGFATVQKRVDLLIAALGSIKNEIPPFELWIVGDLPDSLGLRQLAAECGLKDRLRTTGRVDMTTFQACVDASDLVVNLRFPSAGETSATLIRALGAGKPAVVFDYGASLDYPDDCLVKIPLEISSHAELADAVRKLACDPDHRRQRGSAAAEYIKSYHGVDRAADAYASVLSNAAAGHPD